ncbi:AraC family transcriptional regulator [Paenibacillus physcomitrellae]|uniref:HTH araC/xylS-type domain-containing protein n=1 Tax=Paenibacillus physcomitrellae TaxID=1619311 RepID=A0ABQ1GCE7_9BACL|nr:helix-turn-helix domain-containing protein [Paenibacillus physcomitrellae]GGA41032.1 hypothetical protein GCM10010917_27860 [Paenibacillus physcomitrellae]
MDPKTLQPWFDKRELLERLDITIPWGHYELRVLRFHLTSFPAGRVVGFHNHAEFEFHFIPSGKGKVIFGDGEDGQEHALSEEMLYLTPPGVMHHQEADAAEAMDEFCLHVDIAEKRRAGVDPWEIAEAQECVEKLRSLPLAPTIDTHKAMDCFLEAYALCDGKLPGYYTSIKHLVIGILLKTVRAYVPEGIQTESEAPRRDMLTYRYQYAIQFMEANHASPITLENVAERLNISSRQLQRIFNQACPDKTFSKALENIRLKAVCRKLEDGALTVEQIAQSEGFNHVTYLHNVFRKRIGMTPAAYRRTLQEKRG